MKDKLIEMLKAEEGLRLKPYTCPAGKLNIGVGRNIEDRGISEDEAMYLLKNDIEMVLNELAHNFNWFRSAPETVQIVLADMCFNMGISRLRQFKNTLAYLESRNYQAAAVEMLDSAWAKQVGGRALKLSDMIRGI